MRLDGWARGLQFEAIDSVLAAATGGAFSANASGVLLEYARAASVGRPVAVGAPAGRADSAPPGGTALGSGSGSLVFGGSGVRGSQRAAAAVAAATDGAGAERLLRLRRLQPAGGGGAAQVVECVGLQ